MEQTVVSNTKGTFNGVTVVDDYAHHPTEIAATLKAAQHYPHNQVWCVFQPHTYTRTKAFFHEFAEALSHTDHLVLADIYAAVRQILSEFLLPVLQRKHVNLEQMHITFQVLKK